MIPSGFRKTYCIDTDTGHQHSDVCYRPRVYVWDIITATNTSGDCNYGGITTPKKNHKPNNWESGKRKKFWEK